MTVYQGVKCRGVSGVCDQLASVLEVESSGLSPVIGGELLAETILM